MDGKCECKGKGMCLQSDRLYNLLYFAYVLLESSRDICSLKGIEMSCLWCPSIVKL